MQPIEIDKYLTPFVGRTGGLISALREVQRVYGFLPDETEVEAARIFNLSRAEVRGVISFYRDFKRTRPGETVVRLCAAEACQAAGGRKLAVEVEKLLSVKMGETSVSGDLTLEPVFCLGLCSTGPAAMVDTRLVGKADADKIKKAIARVKKERAR